MNKSSQRGWCNIPDRVSEDFLMALEVNVCLVHLGVHAYKLTIPASWHWEATLSQWVHTTVLACRKIEWGFSWGEVVGGHPYSRGPSKVTRILYALSITSPSHSWKKIACLGLIKVSVNCQLEVIENHLQSPGMWSPATLPICLHLYARDPEAFSVPGIQL